MAQSPELLLDPEAVTQMVARNGPGPLLEMVADACYAVADAIEEGSEQERNLAGPWREAADHICHLSQDLEFMDTP